MTTETTEQISAVGKALSQDRAAKIQSIFVAIGELLVETGAASVDDLKGLLGGTGQELEAEGSMPATSTPRTVVQPMDSPRVIEAPPKGSVAADPTFPSYPDSVKIAMSGLSDALEQGLDQGWEGALYNLTHAFCDQFDDLHDTYSEPQRGVLAQQLIDEYAKTLKTLSESHPAKLSPEAMAADNDSYSSPVMAEATSVQPDKTETPVEIKASAMALPMSIKASKKVQSGNRIIFEGVLARINEASEGVPSVGTGLPLYLPMDTAHKIVAQVKEVKSLPIDTDDSLSKHNDESIVGVITDALIQGQNLVVKGHLFPFNVPKKVRLLMNNRAALGMSMNAMVKGSQDTVGGKNVFVLRDVDLQGANVLLAQKATYQQSKFTPLAAASPPPRGEAIAVAASQANTDTNNESQPYRKTIIMEELLDSLQTQLKQVQETSVEATTQLSVQLAASQKINEELVNRLAVLEADRKAKEEAEEAQRIAAAKLEKEKEVEELITSKVQAGIQALQEGLSKENQSIEDIIAQKIEAGLKQFRKDVVSTLNPNRQVRQFEGTPLVQVAAEAAAPVQVHPLKAEYDALQLQAKALENSGATGANRIILSQKITMLKAQAATQGVAL